MRGDLHMHTFRTVMALGAMLGAVLTVPTARAQDGMEPLGGQPPAGATASVKDFDYQIKYQRAFEAVLWNMPAIAIYSFRRAAFDNLGVRDNDIIAYSAPATPKLEAITANSTTPYITAFTDLRQGPVVLEVPAASAEGSVYGQVVDAWQFTIADVGPSGLDKGAGGKLLFTPPGYQEAIPAGYIHVPSPNFRIALAFRSVPAPGKSAADAYQYSKKLRMYYLSEAGSPPEQRFVDPIDKRYPTLPFYDGRHFEDMHAIMSVEPVNPHDKVRHTHGGMILGLDRLVARSNNGFVSGLYRVGGMTLYVNNGTALWPGFALRLGRPSELTRITLRRTAQQVSHHLQPAMGSGLRQRAAVAAR
jgi:Protein of unknown function (DUF1254)